MVYLKTENVPGGVKKIRRSALTQSCGVVHKRQLTKVHNRAVLPISVN